MLLKDVIGIVMEGIVLVLEVGMVDTPDSGVHFNLQILSDAKFKGLFEGMGDIL